MAAGQRSFDDETVRADQGVPSEVLGQDVRGDDGQESGAAQRGQRPAEQGGRIQVDGMALALGGAGDIDWLADRLVPGQRAEQPGHLPRDAGSHQHRVDAGQHRAVGCRGHRHLDLLKVVHPHRASMALPGQPDLSEVRHHRQFLGVPVLTQPEPGDRGIRHPRLAAIRAEVPVEDTRGDLGDREGRQRRARITTGIPVLQPAREHSVKRRTRHDPELADGGHGPRERPGRDGHAHTALDKRGQRNGVVPQHHNSNLRQRSLR